MFLPTKEPRCIGNVIGSTYQLRLECIQCQRRTAPRAEVVVWQEDELPTEHPCPQRIAPEEK
jgi:hypothetical protein